MTLETTLAHLRERLTRAPRTVLILGSGLGRVAEAIEDALHLPYREIPGFPVATVAGHEGALTVGILEGVEVIAMAGRFHLYEGWTPEEIAFPLRVFAALGADSLVVTNASGAIRPDLKPGDLVLIEDHLNLLGCAPPPPPDLPAAALPLTEMYDADFRLEARRVAHELGIPLATGIYAAMTGPSYETPAEIRMLDRMGAELVGMSTVPEVLAARSLGMRVLGLSCVTNYAAGRAPAPLSHAEVVRAGSAASGSMERLLRAVLPRIVPSNLPTEAAS